MFKFFKTPESQQKEEIITSKIIQADLHKSFNNILKEFELSASKETQIEDLRSKLELFKEENKIIYDKVDKLKQLNLTNTPSVQTSLKELQNKENKVSEDIMVIKREINKVNEIQNYAKKYSLKYPTYKFIDDSTMINIMKKYDLVLGEAFTYGREIPDENLEIISYFSAEIKESEKTYNLVESGGLWSSHFTIQEATSVPKNDDGYKVPKHLYPDRSIRSSYKISKFKMIAPESHFNLPTYEHGNNLGEVIEVPIMKINKNTRKYEFDTSKINELEKIKRDILDPIAVLEVDGGYIVLTAWDEEANIIEIQNTFLN